MTKALSTILIIFQEVTHQSRSQKDPNLILLFINFDLTLILVHGTKLAHICIENCVRTQKVHPLLGYPQNFQLTSLKQKIKTTWRHLKLPTAHDISY